MTIDDLPKLLKLVRGYNANLDVAVEFEGQRAVEDFVVSLSNPFIEVETPWIAVRDRTISQVWDSLRHLYENEVEWSVGRQNRPLTSNGLQETKADDYSANI